MFIPLQKDVQSKHNNNVETHAVIVSQPEHGVYNTKKLIHVQQHV